MFFSNPIERYILHELGADVVARRGVARRGSLKHPETSAQSSQLPWVVLIFHLAEPILFIPFYCILRGRGREKRQWDFCTQLKWRGFHFNTICSPWRLERFQPRFQIGINNAWSMILLQSTWFLHRTQPLPWFWRHSRLPRYYWRHVWAKRALNGHLSILLEPHAIHVFQKGHVWVNPPRWNCIVHVESVDDLLSRTSIAKNLVPGSHQLVSISAEFIWHVSECLKIRLVEWPGIELGIFVEDGCIDGIIEKQRRVLVDLHEHHITKGSYFKALATRKPSLLLLNDTK